MKFQFIVVIILQYSDGRQPKYVSVSAVSDSENVNFSVVNSAFNQWVEKNSPLPQGAEVAVHNVVKLGWGIMEQVQAAEQAPIEEVVEDGNTEA